MSQDHVLKGKNLALFRLAGPNNMVHFFMPWGSYLISAVLSIMMFMYVSVCVHAAFYPTYLCSLETCHEKVWQTLL